MTSRPNLPTGAVLLALFAAFFWAQHDDAAKTGNPPTAAAQSAPEGAEAIARRELAGQRACGPHTTPEWLDSTTHRCLRHADQPTLIAGGRP